MPECFICELSLEDSGSVTTVHQVGIATLIKASEQRQDGKGKQLKKRSSVEVHDSCRKSYTHTRAIAAHLRRLSAGGAESRSPSPTSVPQRVRRSSQPKFDFKAQCFFCAKEITEKFLESESKKPFKARNVVYKVRDITGSFRRNLLKTAEERNDELGEALAIRIQPIEDLVAYEAQYHLHCYKDFHSGFAKTASSASGKRGPFSREIEEAMSCIYNSLENNTDECQFSLEELMNLIQGDFIPDKKTVKAHLQRRYGDNIIFTVHQNRKTIVCLKDIGEKVLKESWYQNKCANDQEENLRVVEAAAKIIRADIRAQVYDVDQYPPPDHFMDGAESVIPPTLKHFMETLVVQEKKGGKVEQSWKTRCTAFAHCIMSAARPRSFLSHVKIGLAAFIYKKFASRKLLDVLHTLGFSSSYHEAVRFEVSSSLAPQVPIEQKGFMQFVFDNADFNTQTVDGYNTFHVMGGIYTVAPSSVVKSDAPITRLNAIPLSEAVGKFGHVDLKRFVAREGDDGLKAVTIEDLSDRYHTSETVSPSAADVLWLFSKYRDFSIAPGWNVFMEQLTADFTFDTSFTGCLPFINAPPSDYDTVYTSLVGAAEKTAASGQQCCLVTFDQPLYMKARYIIANTTDDRLKNVIPRLGGFHLLMSFLGAIGFIMEGSGLKELFNVIFAMNSIDKMMGGHAYYRALRGHILSHAALMKIIFKMMDLTDMEEQLAEIVYDFDKPMILAADPPQCRGIRDRLNSQIADLKKRGPTAQLWVQYLQMVNLVKQFILSERMGNWELHLETVWQMLPYFHASGRFAYAKCAHLYLQDMTKLKTSMPQDEYNKFATEGFFTVRRLPNKFWSGTWTDMLIEQFLMKNMKVSGGLTHGRGVTEAVQTRWTMAMTSGQHVCEAMENFCNVSFGSSEQHHFLSDARTLRDNKDLGKLYEWLQQHTPFPQQPELFSIATGVVGDDRIDCHTAWDVGMKGIKDICGQDFGTVKFKRTQRVKPLALMNSGIAVGTDVVPINPTTLFQRITVAKHSEEELERFLSYDLAPYSLTLFDNLDLKRQALKKTAKSTLYKAFTPLPSTQLSGQVKYVIDGGYLLHRVPWPMGSSFSNICDSYITYITTHYGPQPEVVFDGYPPQSAGGTKTAERLKRCRTTSSVDILIDGSMVPTMAKATFLSNLNNKNRLIAMLGERLSAHHLQWQQAEEDADTTIVERAMELAPSHEKVVVVGEDIDLLVILIGRSKQGNIFFLKPGKDKELMVMFAPATAANPMVSQHILFLHAISGCDTTSSFFNLGKMRFVKTLIKNPNLQEAIGVYKDPEATRPMLEAAGERFVVEVYGYTGQTPPTLNQLRFSNYKKMAFKRNSNLATLPPSAAALRQHCYRAYHQVQQWLGLNKNPQDWGWRMTSGGLQPITTDLPPAPTELLKLITCKCTTNCTRNCGCKKSGLFCSTMCANCQGTCANALHEEDGSEDPDVDQEALAFSVESSLLPATIDSEEPGPSKKMRLP